MNANPAAEFYSSFLRNIISEVEMTIAVVAGSLCYLGTDPRLTTISSAAECDNRCLGEIIMLAYPFIGSLRWLDSEVRRQRERSTLQLSVYMWVLQINDCHFRNKIEVPLLQPKQLNALLVSAALPPQDIV